MAAETAEPQLAVGALRGPRLRPPVDDQIDVRRPRAQATSRGAPKQVRLLRVPVRPPRVTSEHPGRRGALTPMPRFGGIRPAFRPKPAASRSRSPVSPPFPW
ncbi:hypothetical protein GCM10020366_41210 [Saccharopolyspora gregorii]|uniref:Uncharacterized protein n=1 Tax=Saccharopolyspora gregorii TaxID=33914 RepID=A0ABP6RVJ6_9PSEU